MKYKDYYKLLEIDTSRVSIDEIKSAYRAVAKKYHPDVNVNDKMAEERIKDINEAYRVLSTPNLKRKYDRAWNSKNNVKNYQKLKGGNIFTMFMGQIDRSGNTGEVKDKPVKGDNIQTEIQVSIEDAFYGKDKKISLKTAEGRDKSFSVKIPEGIKNGERIRLIGQGKKGKNGGKNGDIFIKINIEKDENFKLQGNDVHTYLKLTPWEAALGAKVELTSFDEKINVYIPQGTQSGEKIDIPDKGYKDKNGIRGKLIAEVKIMIPNELEKKEKEAFEKLKELSSFNPRS